MFNVIRFVTCGSFVIHTTAAVYSYITSYEYFKHHLSRVTYDEERFRAYIVSFKLWGRNYEFRFLKRLDYLLAHAAISYNYIRVMYPKGSASVFRRPWRPLPRNVSKMRMKKRTGRC